VHFNEELTWLVIPSEAMNLGFVGKAEQRSLASREMTARDSSADLFWNFSLETKTPDIK